MANSFLLYLKIKRTRSIEEDSPLLFHSFTNLSIILKRVILKLEMIKGRHEGGITVAKRHIGSGIIVLEFCGELRGKFVVSIDWWNSPVVQTFRKIWNWIAAAYGMRSCRIDSSSLRSWRESIYGLDYCVCLTNSGS